MTINFKRYLNTTIMVSMPALFPDAKARPFKLIGVELPGVWLQSDELADLLLPEEFQQYAAAGPLVFVPFAHIAGILVPTTRPVTIAAAQTQTPTQVTGPPAGASKPKKSTAQPTSGGSAKPNKS